MSVRRIDKEQPESFALSEANRKWADELIAKYPDGKQRSAVIPLLWRAQEQAGGWLPEPAIRDVAERLGMAKIRVLEVATFYTMFNLSPVGEIYVQLCGTTPCMLRGSEDLKKVCEKVIGPQGRISEDGKFSWIEVECLGACCNAPMVQINEDYFEDLDPQSFEKLLVDLREGREVKPGPQNGRQGSCPIGGPTTLLDEAGGREMATPRGGVKETETPTLKTAPDDEVAPASVGEEFKPQGLAEARGGNPDDLKKISGVGPKLEGTLNELGIYHFDQIATWTKDNITWVDDYLSFKGRIERDDWIGQAQVLATDAETVSSTRREDGGEGN